MLTTNAVDSSKLGSDVVSSKWYMTEKQPSSSQIHTDSDDSSSSLLYYTRREIHELDTRSNTTSIGLQQSRIMTMVYFPTTLENDSVAFID